MPNINLTEDEIDAHDAHIQASKNLNKAIKELSAKLDLGGDNYNENTLTKVLLETLMKVREGTFKF